MLFGGQGWRTAGMGGESAAAGGCQGPASPRRL